MESITAGVDLAKQVFAVCDMDAQGRVTQRRELKRDGLAEWLAQLPAGTVVAMEACSSAHYWGRVCLDHGLQPRLMAAQFVKPFRKSAVIKNDRNDAEAIKAHAEQDERCGRIRGLTGVGPLTADAIVATLGNAHEYKNGRQCAAWMGLTPSQHGTGGKVLLGSITCRGDDYLRTMLIQGARSSVQRARVVAPDKRTPEQQWIVQLSSRLPFGKVLVAIANKHARQIWAMLARGEDYDAEAWLKHPMVQRG